MLGKLFPRLSRTFTHVTLHITEFLCVNSRLSLQCDESHPTCIQCGTAQLRCMYAPGRTLGASQSSASPRTASRDGSSLDPSAASVSPSNIHPRIKEPTVSNANFSIAGTAEDNFKVTMLHIQLLHHFTAETAKTLFLDTQETQISQAVTIKAALSALYLMQEILALSALHLSVLHPAQQEFYHHQASGLQTCALTIFDGSHLVVDDENCVSIALFSFLSAIHSLCGVVSSLNNDYSNFLNSFIHCFDLHRDLRPRLRAIKSHALRLLQQLELQEALAAGEEKHNTNDMIGKECDELRALLSSADLGPASMAICEIAIDHLQRTFDREHMSNGRDNTFASWPILVPTEYMNLVIKRNPEALVILAHYAVLLHAHRRDWFIGEAGRYLIHEISRHLGSYWDNWMAWPKSVLLKSSCTQHLPRLLSPSPAAAG